MEKTGVLEQYISSLSKEERENYRDLIEEFRAMDAGISKDCEDARRSIQKLGDLEIKIIEKLKELEVATERLMKSTANLYLNLVDSKKMHS